MAKGSLRIITYFLSPWTGSFLGILGPKDLVHGFCTTEGEACIPHRVGISSHRVRHRCTNVNEFNMACVGTQEAEKATVESHW